MSQKSFGFNGSESGNFMALIRSLRNSSAGGSGALRLYMLDSFKSFTERACQVDVDGGDVCPPVAAKN